MNGAKVFTKLDLGNAYHLLRIREGDEKMSFNTPSGHYEFFVMSSGLNVFQALLNDILRDMLNKFVFLYLDDILIYFYIYLLSYSPHKTGCQETLRQPAVCYS